MSKATIVFEAPFWSRSGYGDHARDLLKSLININEYDVKIIVTYWGDCPNDEYLEFEQYLLKDGNIKPNVYIKLGIPTEFQKKAPYSIGITAGIETTMCPGDWVEGCNRMDMVIVPSQHSKDVILNTIWDKMDNRTKQKIGTLKCEKPIEVLFEGVDTNVFYKLDKSENTEVDSILDGIPEDFCFLYAGHWIQGDFGHDRKDVGSVIKTFIETFRNTGKTKRPALVLKTSGATFSIIQYEDIYKKIKNITDNYKGEIPNIYVIEGNLSNREMNCLYNHKKIKAMVSFTHGEGYGRPLAEFSITQKPVIASNWSGQVDFLTHSVKLPGALQKVHSSAANNMVLGDSQWFYVDYVYAGKKLKDVFKNYKRYLPDARKQARLIREDFNLNEMTNKFKDILTGSLPKFAKKIKLNIPKLEKVNE
jgi:glycosyltransferase involved in cell wall biosynthesis